MGGLVEILMATYNGERYLAEQIDSIIAQTYADWRLLVSDDGSSDGTLDILRAYEQQDSRIKVVAVDGHHGHARSNFWSLLPYARGDRIMFCDQDDVWHEGKIEKTLRAIDELESAYGDEIPLMVYADMRVVDADLNTLDESYEKRRKSYPVDTGFAKLLMLNPTTGCTMMFNRAACDMALETTSCDDGMVMHDWWLALIVSAFGEIAYIDEPVSLYRQHGGNSVGVKKRSVRNVPNRARLGRRIRLHLGQANYFQAVYGSRLQPEDAKTLDHLVRSGAGGVKGLYHLFRSGSWKKSLRRKAGQVYATLFLLKSFS